MYEDKSPFVTSLKQVMGDCPVIAALGGITHSNELDEESYDMLVDWCSYNTPVPWWTGISIVEAVDNMVADAISNGNLGG